MIIPQINLEEKDHNKIIQKEKHYFHCLSVFKIIKKYVIILLKEKVKCGFQDTHLILIILRGQKCVSSLLDTRLSKYVSNYVKNAMCSYLNSNNHTSLSQRKR